MRRLLPEEIDAAVQEVERLKAALSCSTDGESYLGMRGGVEKDRQVLCSLLHLAMQALDRLREKEIEVLKAASAAATATGKFARLGQVPPSPEDTGDSHISGAAAAEARVGAGEGQKLSDVKTWVSCRALLDSVGVGDLRLVDCPVPRAELSVTVDALHLFPWPPLPPAGELAAGGIGSTEAAAEATAVVSTEPERAGLAVYLDAVLRPGRGNEWIVPLGAGAAAGGPDNSINDDDFLSVPCGESFGRQSDGGAAAAAAGGSGVGVLRGGAPSAAVCLSEAVSSGVPSLGLRVLLEIVRPPTAPAAPPPASSPQAVAGAGGQAALYRAIAVLVAANRKSPLTRPVVVLTDLREAWKLLWLGGARPGWGRSTAGGEAAGFAGEFVGVFGAMDVYCWRLSAADAASVVQSMLQEEAVEWDGQVSWPWPSRRRGSGSSGGGGSVEDARSGAREGGGVGGRGRGGGDGDLSGPLAVLRERHLVTTHSRRQRGLLRSLTSGPAGATAHSCTYTNNGGGGSEGIAHYLGGVGRTSSPPLAMEMALRRGAASSSYTGHHSLPGQRMAGGSLGDVAESQPRESRAFSHGGWRGDAAESQPRESRSRAFSYGGHQYYHHGNGVDRADEADGYVFDEPFGGGGGGGGSGSGGGGGGHLSNGYPAHGGGGYAGNGGGSHAALNGYSGGAFFRDGAVAAAAARGSPLAPSSPLAGGRASDQGVLRHLMGFAAGDGFLFVAGVSRGWRAAWGIERPPETTIDAAVQSPSRLGWARASGLDWGPNVCARAAAGAHLATLRYARALKCPWDWRTCAHAATKAMVPVCSMIQWAASREPAPSPSSSGSSGFVPPDDPPRPRRLEVLQWCRDNGCPWDESTISEAAREGNMDILRYAKMNGCPWNVLTCAYAAAAGHLDILKWAREDEGCGWDASTCAFAAAGGHLEVLKWVRSKGCPWGEETCASAARAGRLEVLQWCRQNGCPWGGGTCANSAEGGHLDVLKWARSEGCPWTEATCTLAARENQLEILKWCRENGCNWASSTFRAAAGVGNMEMLRFLFDEGCPWDRRTCAAAARNSDLEALRWLRERGCPWDSRTLDAAAEVGAMDLFEWATSNNCPS